MYQNRWVWSAVVTSKQSGPVSLKMLTFLPLDTGGFNIEMTRSFVGMTLKSMTVSQPDSACTVVTSFPSGKCFQDASSSEPSFKASRCFCAQCCSESVR